MKRILSEHDFLHLLMAFSHLLEHFNSWRRSQLVKYMEEIDGGHFNTHHFHSVNVYAIRFYFGKHFICAKHCHSSLGMAM